jgi:hypothetical protein
MFKTIPKYVENSPFGREKSLGSTLPHLTQPKFGKPTLHLISPHITPTQKITPFKEEGKKKLNFLLLEIPLQKIPNPSSPLFFLNFHQIILSHLNHFTFTPP